MIYYGPSGRGRSGPRCTVMELTAYTEGIPGHVKTRVRVAG